MRPCPTSSPPGGRNDPLKANFTTCYRADNSIDKIRTSPLWIKKKCLDALS